MNSIYYPRHHASPDPLTVARQQADFWRLCTAAAVTALIVTAAVRHPSGVALLFCMLALCTLVAGGALLQIHRDNVEMGIAPREEGK